ncbi:MAG: laccase domain-containing protein [Patescibacteria group bacterium]|nr:laccase domain-containing protein [Patescibacteria group bacterium]
MVATKATPLPDEDNFIYNTVNGILLAISTEAAGNMDFRFSVREDVLENRRRMAGRFGIDHKSFVFMSAEMKSEIALVSDRNGGQGLVCDAMFASESRVFPIILPGDCSPIFIVHRDVWGIIHAGRANASTVIPASISWLGARFNANPSALITVIGPTIRETYVFPKEKKGTIKAQLEDDDWRGCIDERVDGYHVHLDKCVAGLLRKSGVPPARIVDLGLDTAHGFFSHSLGKEGRHACFIGRP